MIYYHESVFELACDDLASLGIEASFAPLYRGGPSVLTMRRGAHTIGSMMEYSDQPFFIVDNFSHEDRRILEATGWHSHPYQQ